MRLILLLLIVLLTGGCLVSPNADTSTAAIASATVPSAEHFRKDARSIESLINENYAYLDRFEGGVMPMSDRLRAEAERVNDRRSLLRHAERALLALADHHAITGANLANSWAVVPSYADLWVELRGGEFVIESVRQGSPATEAGIQSGDELIEVSGIPVTRAVESFWADLGLPVTAERAGFAARVLVAGRRDRPRRLTVRSGTDAPRVLELPNLYQVSTEDRPPLSTLEEDGSLVIRINNSLGNADAIAAFDAAMTRLRPEQKVVIDLRDTPGGGNTTVARAILG